MISDYQPCYFFAANRFYLALLVQGRHDTAFFANKWGSSKSRAMPQMFLWVIICQVALSAKSGNSSISSHDFSWFPEWKVQQLGDEFHSWTSIHVAHVFLQLADLSIQRILVFYQGPVTCVMCQTVLSKKGNDYPLPPTKWLCIRGENHKNSGEIVQ